MSRRKGQPDPLRTVNELRWLVLRNQLSQAEWSQQLLPNTDLKAALAAGRDRLIQEGCTMQEMTRYSFVFGQRGSERICLVIEALAPDAPRIGHGTHLCGNAPGR
jgi:hypothetical protein